MKNFLLILSVFFPFILFAQKGTIVPDVKSTTGTPSIPDGIKVWQMEDYLVKCLDSSKLCYIVKENGVRKTIPQDDVYDFVFEEGFKYTLQVKEEVKPPPVNAFDGIYNYIVVKVISRKESIVSSNSIPTVSKAEANSKTKEIPSTEKSNVYVSPPNTTPEVIEDLQQLKKQVKDLKKQVELLQMQLEMQFQLILKNNK